MVNLRTLTNLGTISVLSFLKTSLLFLVFCSVNTVTTFVCICNLGWLLLPFVADLVFLFILVLHSFSIQFHLPAAPFYPSTPIFCPFPSQRVWQNIDWHWLYTQGSVMSPRNPRKCRGHEAYSPKMLSDSFSIMPCYGICCLFFSLGYRSLSGCVCARCPVKLNSQGLCCWKLIFVDLA